MKQNSKNIIDNKIKSLKIKGNILVNTINQMDRSSNDYSDNVLKLQKIDKTIDRLKEINSTEHAKKTQRITLRIEETDKKILNNCKEIIKSNFKDCDTDSDVIRVLMAVFLVDFIDDDGSKLLKVVNSTSNNDIQNDNLSVSKLQKQIAYIEKDVLKILYLNLDEVMAKEVNERDNIKKIAESSEPFSDNSSILKPISTNIDNQIDKHFKYFKNKKW